MFSLVIGLLYVLVAIALLVGLYWLAIWVFAKLEISVPERALRVVMVVLVLVVIIWMISALHAGRPIIPAW